MCYGPRIAAVIVCLSIGQFLSNKRTAQALAELFGVPLSGGTVASVTGRAAGRLGGFLEQAREQTARSDVAGSGETGFRADSRLAWVHCARTGKDTLLMVHHRRGRLAMEALAILPAFAGVAVHDAWSPYDGYASAAHQLCCAHALTELQAVAGTAPAGAWCWATQAADALTAMQKLVSEATAQGHDTADGTPLAAQVHACRSAAVIGASQTAASGYGIALYPFGSAVLHGIGAYPGFAAASAELKTYEIAGRRGVIRSVDFARLMAGYGPTYLTARVPQPRSAPPPPWPTSCPGLTPASSRWL